MQIKQQLGEAGPADLRTLPVSGSDRAPAPLVKTIIDTPARLVPDGPGQWLLAGWHMAAAPSGADRPEKADWMPAVVPGTALVTLIANGRYPDPAYGLNNLKIPETLARQDYWYRTTLILPAVALRRSAALLFEGVNYAADVRIDGRLLGTVRGAFMRGRFALPASLADGQPHRLDVRVSPPPHPGFPQEETLKTGPGNNGGQLAQDGPTFFATEGWDWIPGVRDRDTGLWQGVKLVVTGPVRIGDLDVRTRLPHPDNSVAEVELEVPIVNQSCRQERVTVRASFDRVRVEKRISAPPGASVVRFAPSEFAVLRVAHPRLWWPNGYGAPTLHTLHVGVSTDAGMSDVRDIRFGMREISYDLSVHANQGPAQRILYRPSFAQSRELIAVDHDHIRPVSGGWAPTMVDKGPMGAISAEPPSPLAPYIMLRVNHVPIAVRGGNWGMDDWLKRVDVDRLEPFFRLHRDAHLNTIRNWTGQSTEENFYALADQYGLMVLNDFWISTQDFNAEPLDPTLFLANAEDTVSRFRHHPSIVLWIGRNEGVPPPAINKGLDAIIRRLDGTRYYAPNSRLINMADSGPWDYRPPEAYFNSLAQGFSTEIGTPSFPTLETFESFVPPADRWPISDSWAYHDWHQAAGGDVAPFMAAMTRRLGAPASLTDFERKAQLLGYEAHRAIFEGMNADLFERNSGRLLWMTQPAWPSTNWQMLSYDYDTQGAYWGVAHGAEPVHIQIAADTGDVQLVNSLPHALDGMTLDIQSVDLLGRALVRRSLRVRAPALATHTVSSPLVDRQMVSRNGAMTTLTLRQGRRIVSRNSYWQSADAGEGAVTLANMPKAEVQVTTAERGSRVEAILTNRSDVPALLVKLSVLGHDGRRILPVYLTDNYVSLLPHESRTVGISCRQACPTLRLNLRGWNLSKMNEIAPVEEGVAP